VFQVHTGAHRPLPLPIAPLPRVLRSRSALRTICARENGIRNALDRANSSGRARPLGTVEQDECSAEEDHILQHVLAFEREHDWKVLEHQVWAHEQAGRCGQQEADRQDAREPLQPLRERASPCDGHRVAVASD